MKTSVVLASYNGEKYILEQLESIKNQTISVDEVLIVDDQSTDSTQCICEDFIRKNNLKNWRVEVNSKNLKTIRSFLEAFKRVSGDIIFMSDQDDIWLNNRVETFLNTFKETPDALSIASTFSRFNDSIELSPKTKHPFFKKDGLIKIRLSDFCQFYYYLGMSVAFKKELFDRIHINFENNNISHDMLINYYATIYGNFYYLDKVLTKRRSYPDSVSNSEMRNITQKKYNGDKHIMLCNIQIGMIIKFLNVIQQEKEYINDYFEKERILRKFLNSERKRYEYLSDKKLIGILKNISYYLTIQKGVKLMIKDIIYIAKRTFLYSHKK